MGPIHFDTQHGPVRTTTPTAVEPTEIERLPMERLDPALAAALQPRVDRLGYLGEFFGCAGHQPRALLAWMEFTDALKTALPDRLTEIVALTVAVRSGNDYERNQHERLCQSLGFDQEWVTGILALTPDALPSGDQAVQEFVLASLTGHGRGARPSLDAVVVAHGQEQAVAILFLVGRYVAHALFVNALELAPPVPSIFARTSASNRGH